VSVTQRGFARRAFTLVELVVVLAILGVVGGAIGTLLVRQQRFYRGVSELLYAREGVRDAIEVLASDIRGIAAADTVRLLADSAIEMFAAIGASILCDGAGEGQTLVGLPPATVSGNTLTSLLTEPDTGDIALFYHENLLNGSNWERHRISGFSARSLASTCPASSGFTRAEDSSSALVGGQVVLTVPLSADVRLGAPVRFIRRGRYSLYRASDGDWYLGYRRCNAIGQSVCGPIQPLSGPYRSHSSDRKATGLLFEYFDDHGTPLTPAASPLGLARVDITARAQSRQRLLLEGTAYTPSDSATMSIAIRNRVP
jgi:prepilin-type N-terminal cleavage/methylation domain-containing protein